MFLSDLVNPNVSIPSIMPELVVAATGIIVMLYDSFFPKQRGVTGTISLAGLAISAALLGMMWSGDGMPSAWNGMIATDNLRLSFSFVFLFVSAITVLVSTIWIEREVGPGRRIPCPAAFRYGWHDADGGG